MMADLRPSWCAPDQPYIRLSHSSLDQVQTCERKFEMDKLLTIGAAREESVHLSFGHGYGEFIATYMATGSFELAALDGWLAYYPIIETDNKSQATLYHLMQNSLDEMDKLREEWEVAEFNGIPACELSFRLDIDDTFYYVGYIDVVLKHRVTGKYCVLENKTTGLQLHDLAPMYKFSGQALGYSIVVDEIAGEGQADYDVLYLVGRLGKTPFTETTRAEQHRFGKNLQDRLEWFLTLGQDVNHLHGCLQTGNFPRRAQGCLKFNRTCNHFGSCHLRSADNYREIEKDEIEYQFHYNLEDLIESHIERVQS